MANVQRVEAIGNDGRPYRISRKIMRALQARNYEGANLESAADAAGLRPETLSKALKKPHIAKVDQQMFAERRSAAGPRAWNEVERVAFQGAEDKDRLAAANKILEYTLGKPGADAGGAAAPAQTVIIGQLNVAITGAQGGVLDALEGVARQVATLPAPK